VALSRCALLDSATGLAARRLPRSRAAVGASSAPGKSVGGVGRPVEVRRGRAKMSIKCPVLQGGARSFGFLRPPPPVARDASYPGDCHDPRAGDATISKVRRGSKCGSRFTASPGELRKVIAPSFRWVQRQCATPKCNPGHTKSHPGNARATHRLHLVSAEGYAHVARGLRPVVPWSQQNYTHVHPGYTRSRLGYMKVSPRLHPRHARVMPES
jgi:hypothetical protein